MRTVSGSTPARSLRSIFVAFVSLSIAAVVSLAAVSDADARKRKKRGNSKYAAIVVDAKSGKVLHSYKANERRYPASLTKMMTLYLVFEEMKAGRLSKKSRVVMSKNAASRQPSKLGVRPGRSISTEQAILSLVTKSANDVSVALAEKLSGSEAAFARRMTKKARQLGMKNTVFKNANGLPNAAQYTTAADMAKLGLALREHFPRRFRYFKTRTFKFGRRRMKNHNRLLGRIKGVDGIKTGYTRASGFNLVSSVSTGGRKIVAVVMGGRSGRSRNAAMSKLIRKYLPKATRGTQRRLIARAAPLKRSKKSTRISKRIATAHQASATKRANIQRVKKQILALAKRRIPTPESRNAAQPIDPITTASVSRSKKVSAKAPAKVEGWNIQIAASDDRRKAQQMLASARKKAPRALSQTKTYTQAVKKNGVTLYRARFGGFKSRQSAKNACRALKRKRFQCIALKV